MSAIKIVFGGGVINKDSEAFGTPQGVKQLLDTLEKHNVKNIDSAQLYGESEEYLGNAKAADKFTVDTKWLGGFVPGFITGDNLVKTAKESISRLQTTKVDVFYIHAPDPSVPIEDTLAGVDKVHKAGLFSRFGLSNYKASDVQKVHDHCKEKGYVLPTVYQGNYSAVARLQETVLFPTLRKLGIAFYAYSPMAGGFLTKSKQDVLDGKGRFDPSSMLGKMYSGMYNKPALLEVLATWEEISQQSGISKADLAYRWVTYNSALKPENGDAIIVGGRNVQQLESALDGLKAGPLPKDVADKIDKIWETIEHEAPLDNYHG